MTTELPAGTHFIGPEAGAVAGWLPGDAPTDADIATCVACGLCLPHCPTFRLTGDETASPRGRVAAMRAVAEGRASLDPTFGLFMDQCLQCLACQNVCPSQVPYGRLQEGARAQLEHVRPRAQRILKYLGLEVAQPRGWVVSAATALLPLARPLLGRRIRSLLPRVQPRELLHRLPSVTQPVGDERGTVAVLAGCVQDRWFRPVNRATISVLARNGWRVVVPDGQGCCGALAAHYGRLEGSRRMSRRTAGQFRGADWVVVNAAGCSAHMRQYGHLVGEDEVASRVRDLLEFLDEHGFDPPARAPYHRVALHDPCHLRHAQRIVEAPRRVLRSVPGLEVVDVPDGDRCCGAAGLYNVLQPVLADRLMLDKAAEVASTRAPAVVVANPGCALQLRAGLDVINRRQIKVVHPAELLEASYRLS